MFWFSTFSINFFKSIIDRKCISKSLRKNLDSVEEYRNFAHIRNFDSFSLISCVLRPFFKRINSWYQIIGSLYKGILGVFVAIFGGLERPCSNFSLRMPVFSAKSMTKIFKLKEFLCTALLFHWSCIFFVNAIKQQSLYFIFCSLPLCNIQDNNHSLLQIFIHAWDNCEATNAFVKDVTVLQKRLFDF